MAVSIACSVGAGPLGLAVGAGADSTRQLWSKNTLSESNYVNGGMSAGVPWGCSGQG